MTAPGEFTRFIAIGWLLAISLACSSDAGSGDDNATAPAAALGDGPGAAQPPTTAGGTTSVQSPVAAPPPVMPTADDQGAGPMPVAGNSSAGLAGPGPVDAAPEGPDPIVTAPAPDAGDMNEPDDPIDGPIAVPTDCGTRTGMRGKTSRSVTIGSATRTFIAYLPESASPTTPLPFVYVFHGANQTGQYLYDMTEYAELAESEGIAVVFPDGHDTSSAQSRGALAPWHVTDGPLVCGAGALVSNPDASDLDFVDAMRTDIEQDQCIDADHVFATGFSMGGYMSHHIACTRPDFRAAAPHSGGTMAELSSCKTDRMPIIIFHGTADPLIADNCDDPLAAADPGFPASATLWAEKNGCQSTYQTIPVNGTNGSNGSCYVYDGCPADGQVEMCAFQDMAHCWAGASVCESCIGLGPDYPSATKLQWEFFKQYAW